MSIRKSQSTPPRDGFEAIRDLLAEEAGIRLADTKREMVQSRLAKRLRHHGLSSLSDYVQLLVAQGAGGPERQECINCLTTNKTDFFREPHHFDFLRDTILPRLDSRGRRVRIWSAGCSTGEEPYTLAMTLLEHCPASEGWDVRILASDIDTAVLAHAEKGVYAAAAVAQAPAALLHKYFLRGGGANAGKVAVKPALRDCVTFRHINLIDDPWPVQRRCDVIFCRNVIIYFDRPTQKRLLTRFASQMEADGYLILGHSENLHWLTDTFTPIGGTIYQLRGAAVAQASSYGSRLASAGSARARPAAEAVVAAATPPTPSLERGVEEHTVILGDVKVTRGPAVLKTLLGSCVAACIYDPEHGVGGMNHFSLPGVSDERVSARYGAHAMELLVTGIMKKGGDRNRLRAKVFGGASVIKVDAEHLNIGARNAAFVHRYLQSEGIPVDGECLGGTRGMLVRFHPHLGRAQAKPLVGRQLPEIVRDEERFRLELIRKAEATPDDDIILF